MSSPLRTVLRYQTETFRVQASRSKHLHSLAAASLAAIVLSGCGGGDGSASSIDGAQASGASSEFRSFVSVNPQVKAAIAAQPAAARPIQTKADDGSEHQTAERAADEGAKPQDDSSSNSSSSDSPSSAGDRRNFVNTMISDMSEINDLALKGVNSKYGFSKGPVT